MSKVVVASACHTITISNKDMPHLEVYSMLKLGTLHLRLAHFKGAAVS